MENCFQFSGKLYIVFINFFLKIMYMDVINVTLRTYYYSNLYVFFMDLLKAANSKMYFL